MKKYFYSILAPLTLFSAKVFAADPTVADRAKELCPTDVDCPIQRPEQIFNVLKTIVQYVYTAFFIIAVIFILMGAFSFLNAKGDPTKVEAARKQITWAVVAIAIGLISVGAVQIIQSFITTSAR